MKSIVCALAILMSGSFVAIFSGCAEDNDKKANIKSDATPTGANAPVRPVGPEGNKDLAKKQMQKNQSLPDYPKAQ
jgi:hypothetical protein